METFARLIKRLQELELPKGKYVIFGSGPLAIRKIRDTHDLDVIVTKDVFEDFKNKGWKLRDVGYSRFLEKDGIELWYEWGPGEWNVEELIRDADIIDGMSFVRLESVLEWKKRNWRDKRREKDLKDVKTIEAYMASSKSD
jgi:hypothetical protein